VAWSELLSFDIFASPEAIAKLLPVLEEMEPDLSLIGHQAFETLRIETGIPRFKMELHEKVIPLEAGFEDAIGFEKGCYLGQEIIARLDTLGTPAKMLRRVILEGDEVPEKGTPVHKSGGEGRKIGDVESAVYSPKYGAPVALAFVKRKYNEVDGEVEVEGIRGRLKPLWEMK
jgi:folate-binding protein YgfZ